MTLEETRALIERYGDSPPIVDGFLEHDRELRRRDLSAHEQQASLQREQRQSLENELAAIAAAPSESGTDLRNIILRMRREIQTLSEGRGVQFEFRRRLAILEAYEVKLAAIEERRPGTLRHLASFADPAMVSVDPDHQAAYQRLMQARMERGMDSVDATVLALSAISERSLAETFVPSVTVAPSPRQAEAQMFYYAANEAADWMPTHGTYPNPVAELRRLSDANPSGAIRYSAMDRILNGGTPAPATPPPAPNPLHSITPLPRKIIMDRS